MNLRIHTDGGARGNPGPAACAFVVFTDEKIHEAGKFLGNKTNNFAEYMGVLSAYEWLKNQNLENYEKISFYLDSQLVVKQLKGDYKIKNKNLLELAVGIKNFEKVISKKIEYVYVPREKNKDADLLVNKTLDSSRR